ncbi:MAG: membrane lipoprotein lipid attachment site-containing protein, partial [Alistipes sp.]|nr:membrane lipoprotein lipid attachment site-containing protein [Alistipes sp.]
MKKFLLFAVAAVMLAACSKDAINEQSTTNPFDEAPETLTVGFEDDQTRIELNEAQKTVWTKGDLVSVFYRSDANQKWQYTGETGERVAELTRVDA